MAASARYLWYGPASTTAPSAHKVNATITSPSLPGEHVRFYKLQVRGL